VSNKKQYINLSISQFFTAADISVPEILVPIIDKHINQSHQSIKLVASKSPSIIKELYYTDLKKYLIQNSTLVKKTSYYRLHEFNNSIKFKWLRTRSAAKADLIWINGINLLKIHRILLS
jgi:hypothetical protein